MNLYPIGKYTVIKPYKIEDDSFYGSLISDEVWAGQRDSKLEGIDPETILFLSQNAKKFTLKGVEYITLPSEDIIAIVEE